MFCLFEARLLEVLLISLFDSQSTCPKPFNDVQFKEYICQYRVSANRHSSVPVFFFGEFFWQRSGRRNFNSVFKHGDLYIACNIPKTVDQAVGQRFSKCCDGETLMCFPASSFNDFILVVLTKRLHKKCKVWLKTHYKKCNGLMIRHFYKGIFNAFGHFCKGISPALVHFCKGMSPWARASI